MNSSPRKSSKTPSPHKNQLFFLSVYTAQYSETLVDKLKKLKKKDKALYERVRKKAEELLDFPKKRGKPLSHSMKGRFRVHIGSFVLVYTVDEEDKAVKLLDFDHHDNIYK